MIDVENELYTEIVTALRKQFPEVNTAGDYAKVPAKGQFPFVYIVESDNYMTAKHLDSAGAERFSTLMYEVNVYSNKESGKRSECRAIMKAIDELMYARNFTRLSMTPVPNLEDATIYRITARYRAETDGKKFYRI